MSLLTAAAWEVNAESRIEAFESAWQRAGSANLDDYLPAPQDPLFLSILCELVRIDIEFRWSHRIPRPLEDYLHQYSSLQHDPDALQQVAFEEYRQRLHSGERVTPCEYTDRFGVDITRWPMPATNRADDESRKTCTVPNRELEQALVHEPATENEFARRTPFPKAGESFAGFRIINELGRGAFGRVYLAEQLDLAQRRVALKVSHELNGESQKLAQLQHTNIMPIYSSHKVGTLQVVCMPYYGSTTLAQIIQGLRSELGRLPKSGRIFLSTLFARSETRRSSHDSELPSDSTAHGAAAPTLHDFPAPTAATPVESVEELEKLARMSHVEAVLWITARIADGLAHAHSRQILHRDLKPANILLTDEGQPMLLDFNLATSQNVQSLARFRNGGTLPYMSPEQLIGLAGGKYRPDPRSDLFSVGIILYELLTGRHPFRVPKGKISDVAASMVQDRMSAQIDPRRFNPQVTPAVASIVKKALAPNPDQRYQSATHLLEDLERHLDCLPLKYAREASLRERVEKFRRRHPSLWTGVLVTLAASVLVILPLTLQTVKQYEIAQRRKETQRAEAVVLLGDTIKEAKAAQLDLISRTESSKVRERGMERVENLARRYGISGDDHWTNRPEVSRLSDDERNNLMTSLAQTMWVMAESCRQHAADIGDPELRDRAHHWQHLARKLFERTGRVPMALQPGGKSSVQELHADLSKLDVADLYSQACEAVNIAKYREGLRLLVELTRRDPSHLMAWYLRGMCHSALGQTVHAAEAWTVCIALQPDFAWAYHNRGIIRMQQSDYSAAHKDFASAVEIDRSFTSAAVQKGVTSLRLKQFVRAEQELTAALSHDRAPMRAYVLRALARRELGKIDLAKADEVKAMAMESTDDVDWVTRGWARMAKEPHAALADFEQALAINPRNFYALWNRVHVLYTHLSEYDKALQAAIQLLLYYPDHLGARASRGVIYARLGRVNEAKKDAQYCLSVERSAFCFYQIGSLYAQLAVHDPTAKEVSIQLLAKSLDRGLTQKEYFATDKDLDPLRNDPDFQRLARIAGDLSKRTINFGGWRP